MPRNVSSKRAKSTSRPKKEFVTREQVLVAFRKDPSGELLADLLIRAGVGARVEPSRDYERFIPLPAL